MQFSESPEPFHQFVCCHRIGEKKSHAGARNVRYEPPEFAVFHGYEASSSPLLRRAAEDPMKGLTIVGAVLVVLGLLGFAIPIFTTQQTKDVAKLGDLKLQTTESTSHVVPPFLSGGALVLGVILIGAGFYRNR
jgi:hypothetical protein